MRRNPAWPFALLLVGALLSPDQAQAYVGPGAGLTVIGTVLALVAAVVLALVGFVWYPIKRLMKRNKVKETSSGPQS